MKLRAYYGRENRRAPRTLLLDGPNRPDMRLLSRFLSEEFLKELESRGYDLTTLKFSVERREGP